MRSGRENELESHAHVVESAWIGLEQNVLTVALALTLFRTSFAALIPVPVRKDLVAELFFHGYMTPDAAIWNIMENMDP